MLSEVRSRVVQVVAASTGHNATVNSVVSGKITVACEMTLFIVKCYSLAVDHPSGEEDMPRSEARTRTSGKVH